MANGHGGKRPGSGPAKGAKYAPTITKEAGREIVRQFVLERLQPMLEAQVAHSQGLKYLVVRDAKTGKFTRITKEKMDQLLEHGSEDDFERLEVWDKDPSVQAFTDLLNRALDKPKEQEQEHKIDGKLEITISKPW